MPSGPLLPQSLVSWLHRGSHAEDVNEPEDGTSAVLVVAAENDGPACTPRTWWTDTPCSVVTGAAVADARCFPFPGLLDEAVGVAVAAGVEMAAFLVAPPLTSPQRSVAALRLNGNTEGV